MGWFYFLDFSFVFGDGVGVIVEGSAADTEEKVPTSAAAHANFFDDVWIQNFMGEIEQEMDSLTRLECDLYG